MRNIFIILICLILFISTSYTQYGSSGIGDAKSAGLAGTYNNLSKGSHAFGINPANILQPRYRGDLLFILPLPQINVKSSTDFMNLNDLNYFFGGVNGEARYLTPEDIDRFNDLFKDGGDGSYNVSVNILSFTFNFPDLKGALGFSMSDVFAGNYHIPPSAVELSLKGNVLGRFYSFNEADFKSWWIRNYSITYARDLRGIKQDIFNRIYAGITLKLVHGYLYAGSEHVNSFFQTSSKSDITARADYLAYTSFTEDIGVDYTFDDTPAKETNLHIFPPPAGSGFGFDLGFSTIYKKYWNFSLALTDLGYIKWKNKAARFLAKGDIILSDAANHADRDSIMDLISGNGTYISSFTTGLPFALRTGASYSFINQYDAIPGNLVLAVDYNQGFNSQPGNTTIPRVSFAGEWQPLKWSMIRMGFSFGGLDGFNWAAGLGFAIGVLELNFATTNLLAIPAPNDSKKLSLAFNSRWRWE